MSNKCFCSPYFTGVYNKTYYIGDTVDLADGVTAYDGYGNVIEFTYSPTEIDTSKKGTYKVKYTAYGESNNMLPSIPLMKKVQEVYTPSVCPVLERITATRTIKII